MAYPNDEWQRKGATLSEKTARQEFGLTQDQIYDAMDGQAAVPPSLHAREPVAETAPPRGRVPRPGQARRPFTSTNSRPGSGP